MRPTDENQGPSTRPNLMSSRRGAGEENILAMLERDAARRSGTRMTSPRLAWYCAAAAFSGILVGAVAWLAYDNHETATAMQVQVQAERVAEADTVTPAQADAPAPAPAAPAPAVIVDQPHSMPAAPPPLVMLPPEGTAKTRPVAPPKESAPVQAATAPTPAKPAQPAEARPAKTDRPAALAKADRSSKAEKAEKAEKAPPRTAKATRPAAAKAGAAARARNKAASPTAAEPAVDTDVALISAIIAHSERHRGEREQPAPCTGPKCPPQSSAPPRP